MERTKKNNKRPTALLCGDWHIREDIPKCRTDDFWEAQWKKVAFISALQKQYDCPVLHSGDVFEHWKPSPYLLAKTIRRFPDQFWTVYGNHDLPAHSLAQSEKSGIEVLMAAEKIQILDGSHWEQTPKNGSLSFLMGPHYNVLVWHVMTYQGKPPWPGCTDLTAIEILEKYPQFDLIVTGHNHKTFVEEMDGRLLVNPGSLTRQTADQVKHKPCVFLWYAQTNTIKQVFLPYEKGVISRAHIDVPQERKERMRAYIERMNLEWEVGFSFTSNLEIYFKENKTTRKVQELIWTSME